MTKKNGLWTKVVLFVDGCRVHAQNIPPFTELPDVLLWGGCVFGNPNTDGPDVYYTEVWAYSLDPKPVGGGMRCPAIPIAELLDEENTIRTGDPTLVLSPENQVLAASVPEPTYGEPYDDVGEWWVTKGDATPCGQEKETIPEPILMPDHECVDVGPLPIPAVHEDFHFTAEQIETETTNTTRAPWVHDDLELTSEQEIPAAPWPFYTMEQFQRYHAHHNVTG